MTIQDHSGKHIVGFLMMWLKCFDIIECANLFWCMINREHAFAIVDNCCKTIFFIARTVRIQTRIMKIAQLNVSHFIRKPTTPGYIESRFKFHEFGKNSSTDQPGY